ncbi:hypothetical protein AAMO2058_000032700 [Amorphochlora amoebiformis]
MLTKNAPFPNPKRTQKCSQIRTHSCHTALTIVSIVVISTTLDVNPCLRRKRRGEVYCRVGERGWGEGPNLGLMGMGPKRRIFRKIGESIESEDLEAPTVGAEDARYGPRYNLAKQEERSMESQSAGSLNDFIANDNEEEEPENRRLSVHELLEKERQIDAREWPKRLHASEAEVYKDRGMRYSEGEYSADEEDEGGRLEPIELLTDQEIDEMLVTELKEALRQRGLRTTGKKKDLQDRLKQANAEASAAYDNDIHTDSNPALQTEPQGDASLASGASLPEGEIPESTGVTKEGGVAEKGGINKEAVYPPGWGDYTGVNWTDMQLYNKIPGYYPKFDIPGYPWGLPGVNRPRNRSWIHPGLTELYTVLESLERFGTLTGRPRDETNQEENKQIAQNITQKYISEKKFQKNETDAQFQQENKIDFETEDEELANEDYAMERVNADDYRPQPFRPSVLLTIPQVFTSCHPI